VTERQPKLQLENVVIDRPLPLEPVEKSVAEALFDLGLAKHDGTIEATSAALVGLGLDYRERKQNVPTSNERAIDPELLAVLACPACKTSVRLEGEQLVCDTCGRRYPIEDGIPVMLVDSAAR
jgi:uncharacterized protein YbaR (Trm112 family)